MNLFEEQVAKSYKELTGKDVIYENNTTLYLASDIEKYINASTIRCSLRHYLENEKIIKKHITNGGLQSVIFLTFLGLKKYLTNTRNAKAIIFANELGFDKTTLIKSCIESDTLNAIITSFKSEITISQYTIDKYKVDLYFPKFNLIIECDENHHNYNKNKEKDKIRENIIKEKLKCKIIRYQPYSKNFNIFEVINLIYEHIKTNTYNIEE